MIHGKEEKSTLVFSDKINAEYNFDIKSGEVTIYIDNDMTLTNQGLSRSAIKIHPNAKLNLYISKDITLTVDSGLGKDAQGNVPGKGGYAGINVPEGAGLNLYGKGTVIAKGGKAGSGFIGNGLQAGRWPELELELDGNGGDGRRSKDWY